MNNLFFLLSKVFWTLVQPLSLLIILIGFAILALYRGRIGFARRVLVGVSCAFLLIGFFPIGNLVLEPLETRFSIQPDPPSPKTIIVLGGSEDIKAEQSLFNACVKRCGGTTDLWNCTCHPISRRDTCFHGRVGVRA